MQYFVSIGVLERNGRLRIRSNCITDSVPVGGIQRQLGTEVMRSLLRTHSFQNATSAASWIRMLQYYCWTDVGLHATAMV